ncbi:MAG: hypothetical protein AAB215_05260 [Planctomycetota bacterium]
MNGLERFERWAGDARREAAPAPDVAFAVLERLARPEAAASRHPALGAFLSVGSVAALAALGFAGLFYGIAVVEWQSLGLDQLIAGWMP